MYTNREHSDDGTHADHKTMLSIETDLRRALKKQVSTEKRAILKEMLHICEKYREIKLDQ